MFHLSGFSIEIYKKHKSNNYHLFVLEVFPDEFYPVSYTCQICKLDFLFWSNPEFWTRFVIEWFNLTVKMSYLQFWLNILCHSLIANVLETVIIGTF